ncbi:SET domain-containing protein [Apiospora saccharicola]|uniref:SET domain-containing protein n=1 Tax=Apiospora saccharicola TaxID=335842 RepID=A0ABR1TIT2_9PEZI
MGKDSRATPNNWPPTLSYLRQPLYAPHLTKEQLNALATREPDLEYEIPLSLPKGPSTLVKITAIAQPNHPANGQAGLFATRNLAPGSLILPYYGIVHSDLALPQDRSEHEKSDYDLRIDRDACLAVDAAKSGNEARFVNDYRGVRDRPNADFRECWDLRLKQKSMAVFVLPAGKNATRKGEGGIAKVLIGEEICVSYGKGFWDNRRNEG